MLQATNPAQPSSFVFGGRLVAQTDEFSVFESASGRILKLKGISREICERSLNHNLTLQQALDDIALDDSSADQLQSHLLRLRLFHEAGIKGFLKKYLRFRLDVPLIPVSVVSLMCRGVQATWPILTAVSFLLLLVSLVFILSVGGIPFGFPRGFSYEICMTAIIVNTFIHEMGHAYALYSCGQKPGVIGLRIMGPFVAAYTDVNAAWALEPKQRALVSISGLSVQAVVTVIFTFGLYLAVGEASGTVFFWATLLAMIYMVLPVRENDGDWFIRDMMESTSDPKKKTGLYIMRKVFAVSGLVFFLFLISRGWMFTITRLLELDFSSDINFWPHILRVGFLALGTYSMGGLAMKEGRELSGKIRARFQARRVAD